MDQKMGQVTNSLAPVLNRTEGDQQARSPGGGSQKKLQLIDELMAIPIEKRHKKRMINNQESAAGRALGNRLIIGNHYVKPPRPKD